MLGKHLAKIVYPKPRNPPKIPQKWVNIWLDFQALKTQGVPAFKPLPLDLECDPAGIKYDYARMLCVYGGCEGGEKCECVNIWVMFF